MSEFDDPLAQLSKPEPLSGSSAKKAKKPAQAKQSEFHDPLMDELNKAQTARATKSSSMRGQYWQRTLRLPPEYQDLTLEIHLNSSSRAIADTERWIYAMGLHAYYVEGKRPSYVQSAARDIKLPEFNAVQTSRTGE
jgi:hypothetical protein